MKDYHFTYDWFGYNPDHVAVWEKRLAPYANAPEVHYLEIGLFEGRSMIWMLEHILTHATSQAVGIDLFGEYEVGVSWPPGDPYEMCMANLRESGVGYKVCVIKGRSQVVLKSFDAKFDIIYIDGSHLPIDELTDAVLSWPLLKIGGIMIFDDYGFVRHVDGPPEENPKVAIDAFISVYNESFTVLDKYYQLFIRKEKA